eukprot:752741-Hanusia_phi.AAC.1
MAIFSSPPRLLHASPSSQLLTSHISPSCCCPTTTSTCTARLTSRARARVTCAWHTSSSPPNAGEPKSRSRCRLAPGLKVRVRGVGGWGR